jgi:hypothetical protein
MSLYGKEDSVANQTKVALTRGDGAGSASETIIFVDETEAGLAANKERGLTAPGWWAYRTYTDASGRTRHKANHLVVLTDAEANAQETLDDDSAAANLVVLITINTQPVTQSVTVGGALSLSVSAIATPPGDASVLTYQWQKKSGRRWTNIGANQPTYDVAVYADTDAGDYRVKLTSTNGASEVISGTATVTTA